MKAKIKEHDEECTRFARTTVTADHRLGRQCPVSAPLRPPSTALPGVNNLRTSGRGMVK